MTATSDWNAHTLISSSVPMVHEGHMAFESQYGYLVQAIMKNWSLGVDHHPYLLRTPVKAASFAYEGDAQEFRGHWLIIDEFNRGPIDIALSQTLTVLSNGGTLQVPSDGEIVPLPLPQDFRIIGTLNSFDRHYLNQISEALKRRFSFIEVPLPMRANQAEEQNIVLYKALLRCQRFSPNIIFDASGVIWQDIVFVGPDATGSYDSIWQDPSHPLYRVFSLMLWPLFDVIRIYRQLGTAQAIALLAQVLTTGILQRYTEEAQWLDALDSALCTTIADQLQVLQPDELDILLWYMTLDADAFILKYNEALKELKARRLLAHLESLGSVVDAHGEPYITNEQIEKMLHPTTEHGVQIDPQILKEIFHLSHEASPSAHNLLAVYAC